MTNADGYKKENFQAESIGNMMLVLLGMYPIKSCLVLACLLSAGLAEGIGFAALLPLLGRIIDSTPQGTVIDKAIDGIFQLINTEPTIEALLIFIALFIMVKSLLLLLALVAVGYTVAQVTTDFRLSLLDALLRAKWNYFLSQPVGLFSNSVTSESVRAATAYMAICKMASMAIQVLVFSCLALLISWEITVASLLAGTVVVVLLRRFVRTARIAGKRQTELQKSLLSRLTDVLFNLKPLKAMALEDRVGGVLESETVELNKALRLQVASREIMMTMQEPIIVAFLCVVVYFALVIRAMPFDVITVMVLLFHRTTTRFGRLQSYYQRIAESESAFWSLNNQIAKAANAEEHFLKNTPPPLTDGIVFENVHFSFGENKILDGANFKIPAGSFVALTGESGTGKTTTTDLIAGLQKISSGRITIDGTPISNIDLHAWRRSIGYVPQETFLLHDTITHNVTLNDPSLSLDDIEYALDVAGATKFVNSLPDGIHTVVGERGTLLSGGQRQRIAIARALVRRPTLLILDEVTTSLDPSTEAQICASLERLSGQVTIIAISHQSTLSKVANQELKLSGGLVMPSTELITNNNGVAEERTNKVDRTDARK